MRFLYFVIHNVFLECFEQDKKFNIGTFSCTISDLMTRICCNGEDHVATPWMTTTIMIDQDFEEYLNQYFVDRFVSCDFECNDCVRFCFLKQWIFENRNEKNNMCKDYTMLCKRQWLDFGVTSWLHFVFI